MNRIQIRNELMKQGLQVTDAQIRQAINLLGFNPQDNYNYSNDESEQIKAQFRPQSKPESQVQEFDETSGLHAAITAGLTPAMQATIGIYNDIIDQRDQACEELADRVVDELQKTPLVFMNTLAGKLMGKKPLNLAYLNGSFGQATQNMQTNIFALPAPSRRGQQAQKLLKSANS